MTGESALQRARALLMEVTPLLTDCGKICGGVCCHPDLGEVTGMLLFPGEDAYYRDLPGYTMLPTDHGTLLICGGKCRREDRPLSCRIFPLLPLVRKEGIHPAVDLRGKSVCPLARQGKSALCPAFVDAVKRAGEILLEDPEQRRFLEELTAIQDDLTALRRQMGGDRHV